MNILPSSVVVVGLTGQSGAGKTTVSHVFADNGFSVINADTVSKRVMNENDECVTSLKECFGENIINDDGTLNRKKLASIVFTDKEKLRMLNGIAYPYITQEIMDMIYALAKQGKKLILLDAPTLFESRCDDFCQLIISVTANEKTRAKRIAERDGIAEEEIYNRFSSQLDEKFFRQHSDYVITNNKSTDVLVAKAKEVSDRIKDNYADA